MGRESQNSAEYSSINKAEQINRNKTAPHIKGNTRTCRIKLCNLR